jgi:hypothetical protein
MFNCVETVDFSLGQAEDVGWLLAHTVAIVSGGLYTLRLVPVEYKPEGDLLLPSSPWLKALPEPSPCRC